MGECIDSLVARLLNFNGRRHSAASTALLSSEWLIARTAILTKPNIVKGMGENVCRTLLELLDISDSESLAWSRLLLCRDKLCQELGSLPG